MSNLERAAVQAELGRLTSEFFRAVSLSPGVRPRTPAFAHCSLNADC